MPAGGEAPYSSGSSSRQVYPHWRERDELTRHLSLARAAPSDLSPPSRWCQLKDECPYTHTRARKKEAVTTEHFIAIIPLLFFLPPTLSGAKCRGGRDLIVYTSARSPQVSVTCTSSWTPAKLTAAVLYPSPSPFHEVIPGANGRIDGVTSVDAY